MTWLQERSLAAACGLLIFSAAPNAARAEDAIVVHAGDSVQAAIDRAPAGAVIKLEPGTFVESVTITKPLTLEGAGWEKTTLGLDRAVGHTQKERDEFVAAIEAADGPQERARLAAAFTPRKAMPAVTVTRTYNVVLRNLRFRGSVIAGGPSTPLTADALLIFDHAGVAMTDCAVIGPFMYGVTVSTGSDVRIEHSLIAALWATGVAAAPQSTLRLIDSDLRNCFHRCVTLRTDDATIERCRISGSAWHGIRYDDCSPTITNNQIFANARSGIYASGKTAATVRGNVFWRNEMDAMSCWFANDDTVENNTIIGNLREGISVLDNSTTRLSHNVFVENPVAVWCTCSGSGDPKAPPGSSGQPKLEGNIIFKSPTPLKEFLAAKPMPPDNVTDVNPAVGDASTNFALAADSPARAAKAGAADPIAFASPFPIQPEETAIVPTTQTRNASDWHAASDPTH